MEAVVLCGGLGTRFQEISSTIPKSLVKVNESPFLTFLFNQLARVGVSRIILAVGHFGEMLEEEYGEKWGEIELIYSYEATPMGTGGALGRAIRFVRGPDFLVLNGDSFCDFSFKEMLKLYRSYNSCCMILAARVTNRKQFGGLTFSDNGPLITDFFEKKDLKEKEGVVNAGVYLLNKDFFNKKSLIYGDKFSLERDFFPKIASLKNLHGYKSKNELYDIGTLQGHRRSLEALSM